MEAKDIKKVQEFCDKSNIKKAVELLQEKHNPGPWRFHIGRGARPRFHIQTEGGYQIASTPEISQHKPEAEAQEADARLIAAAPGLLQALKHCYGVTASGMLMFKNHPAMMQAAEILAQVGGYKVMKADKFGEIPVGDEQDSGIEQGTITADEFDELTCTCGNTSFSDGFYPCNEKGETVEPTPEDWPAPFRYKCERCGAQWFKPVDWNTEGPKLLTALKNLAEAVTADIGAELDHQDEKRNAGHEENCVLCQALALIEELKGK